MNNKTKYLLTTSVSIFVMIFLFGCTPPVYEHTYETYYDNQGKITGYSDKERVLQQSPSASSMKVKINHRDKLED
jgi:hypothetical protein